MKTLQFRAVSVLWAATKANRYFEQVKSVTVRVPAKINLCLGVGPKRADGFHPLATVYQAVDIYDEVKVTEVADQEISLTVNFDSPNDAAAVPLDEKNIAVQAANLLRRRAGITDGVAITIRKVIPVAGGMAGGSADAAGALVACNELWGTGLSKAELEELAGALGSDVPFLIHGGIAIGSGRGEKVSPVLARGHNHWVLALSNEGLSTASVYGEFDRLNENVEVPQPEIPEDLLAALRAGDSVALGKALSNDLTSASLSLRPELKDVIKVGNSCDVLGALISGSGPTVAFLVRDEDHGADVALALTSAGVCGDVVQALGPVSGARVI